MLDPSKLPYHFKLLEYLLAEYKAGRKIILATGSFYREAEVIAQYLGIFSLVVASDDQKRMIGSRKAHKLRKLLKTDDFIYVGNSFLDLLVWRYSKEAIVVNANFLVSWQAGRISRVIKKF